MMRDHHSLPVLFPAFAPSQFPCSISETCAHFWSYHWICGLWKKWQGEKNSQSWNTPESSFNSIKGNCKLVVCSCLFTTQYSWSGSPCLLSVPADLRLWPRFQAEFGFFSSSPATSHQIRYGALAVLAPLCLSGLTSPPLQRASLTLSVKSSSNCRHIAPALMKKRHIEMYMIHVSPQ